MKASKSAAASRLRLIAAACDPELSGREPLPSFS